MELLFAVVIPFLIAAACAWFRFQPRFRLSPIPLAAFLVLLVGSVLGHEFFHLATRPIPITLDRILMLGTLALFGALVIVGKEDLRILNRVDVAILALMAAISLSTVTHDWSFLRNMPASRLLFFNLMPLALYWVVRTSHLEVADLKFIAVSFGLFGIYLAITAVAEVNEFSAIVFPKYVLTSDITEFLGRGRGPFLNPVSNGIFLTTCFCCVLMWWPRANPPLRLALMICAIVMSIGIYCTLTRSVWLGLIAACGLFIWLPAARPLKGAMLVLATVLTIVAIPILSDNIFSFKRDKEVTRVEMEKSAQLRPLFVIVAWNMFQDRPLFGCGFGQYAREKYPYLQDPHSGQPLSSTKYFMQHNVFLAYLTEMGLVGFSVLTITLIMMGLQSWSLWKDPKLEYWQRVFGLLMVVMLLNYSLNGMFHDVSIIPMQNLLLLFLFGVVNNLRTADAKCSPIRENSEAHDDQAGRSLTTSAT
jgi:O-antigen ligase